jgi:hypothetical protein
MNSLIFQILHMPTFAFLQTPSILIPTSSSSRTPPPHLSLKTSRLTTWSDIFAHSHESHHGVAAVEVLEGSEEVANVPQRLRAFVYFGWG